MDTTVLMLKPYISSLPIGYTPRKGSELDLVLKTKEEAKAHLEAAITYIPDRYKEGVAKADWATPAKSDQAEKNYADAVSKAVTAKKRQKAVATVSNEEWKKQAVDKGAPIIGSRISGALDKYAANFGAVYDQVVTKVGTLPARTTDFRANITARLVPVVETWKKASGKA